MEKKKQILRNRILNSKLSEKDRSDFMSFVENISEDAASKLYRKIILSSSSNVEKSWAFIKQKSGILKSISVSGFLNDEQRDLLRGAALQSGDTKEQPSREQDSSDVVEKTRESLNEFLKEATMEVNKYVNSKSDEADQQKIEKLRRAIQE